MYITLLTFTLAWTFVVADHKAGKLRFKPDRSSNLGRFAPRNSELGLVTPVVPNTPETGVLGSWQRSYPGSVGGTSSYLYCANSGYGICPDKKRCCPLGGLCCNAGDCCKRGFNCCADEGCCPTSDYCVQIDGIPGCCPNGELCGANGSECADSGYVRCSNQPFCCPPGDDCYLNGSGKPACGNGVTFTTQKTTTTTPQPAPTTTTTTTTLAPQTTTQGISIPLVTSTITQATTTTLVIQTQLIATVPTNGLPGQNTTALPTTMSGGKAASGGSNTVDLSGILPTTSAFVQASGSLSRRDPSLLFLFLAGVTAASFALLGPVLS